MEILTHASAKKENKKASAFQILHFYWSFPTDIVVVKGLMKKKEKKRRKRRNLVLMQKTKCLIERN